MTPSIAIPEFAPQLSPIFAPRLAVQTRSPPMSKWPAATTATWPSGSIRPTGPTGATCSRKAARASRRSCCTTSPTCSSRSGACSSNGRMRSSRSATSSSPRGSGIYSLGGDSGPVHREDPARRPGGASSLCPCRDRADPPQLRRLRHADHHHGPGPGRRSGRRLRMRVVARHDRGRAEQQDGAARNPVQPVPGHGAYSFLSRRIGAVATEKMITSGRIYTAEELHEMGIVDVLAEDGKGTEAVHEYIAENGRKYNAHRALIQARRRVNPITLGELRDVVDIWADACLGLSEIRSSQDGAADPGPGSSARRGGADDRGRVTSDLMVQRAAGATGGGSRSPHFPGLDQPSLAGRAAATRRRSRTGRRRSISAARRRR